MNDDIRHFEDFRVGEVIHLGKKTVSRQEIIAFATEFDPQPMHVDAVAAEASMLGGLAASGWHTASIVMRMLVDGVLARSTSLGSPGLESLRWLAPVRPGDTLSVVLTVREVRRSVSKPGMGVVGCGFAVTNDAGAPVMQMEGAFLFGARSQGAMP